MPEHVYIIRLQASEPIKITGPVVDGLAVVARHDGRARVSNQTNLDAGTIHWSAADGLLAARLARWVPSQASTPPAGRMLETTPLGRRAHRQLDGGDAA